MRIVTLKFVNSDAAPKVVSGECDASFVKEVMQWYGSHFAGDRYSVFVDGNKVQKDRNGELVGEL